MRITPKPIQPDELNPFQNDIFGRKFLAESLTDLIKDAEDENIVVGINGQWGEGKTTFAKMWRQYLLNNKFPVIYFDAFENDYVDNAFISIARTILEYSDEKLSSKSKVKKLKKSAVKVAKMLVPAFSRILVSTVTAGIVTGKMLDETGKEIQKIASEESENVIEDYLKEKLDSDKKDTETLSSFKIELGKIAAQLSPPDEKRPLVIILDELDRCKPTFAIEILESIKHLFSVERIIFVLVMNGEQLQESIKSVYGSGIDARTYLQKFLTIEIDFPKNKNSALSGYGSSDESDYCLFLMNQYGLKSGGFGAYIAGISKSTNLSLRDIEKIFSQFIWFRSDYYQNTKRTALVAFLAFIKVKYHSAFTKLSRGELDFKELVKLVPILPNHSDDMDFNQATPERELSIISATLKGCLYSDSQIKLLRNNPSSADGIVVRCLIDDDRMERTEIIPSICRRMNLLKD